MNEKRLKTNIVTVLIALSLFVSFVPSALAQDTAISIGDGSVDPGESVTVPVMIRNATNVGVVDINITFDPTVVNVEVEEIYVDVLDKWFITSDFDNPIPVIDNTTGFARIGAFQSENPGLNGDVGIVNLILTAVGDAGSFTTFDITVNELKEATPEGIDIPATVEDSMFTIRGDGNSVISCDSSGDEKNMFMPGEGIYVKAEGLSPSTSYKVWIQDNPVSDGDALNTSEDPSGIQEVVTSDGSGG
ncbi:MAG: cohesin domain-containing protein, partial [Halobacteriota archaeon]|nr:cohesin domain-containing protein [Halobacteriota archaeon]